MLETPTWRASTDWGDLLGYDAAALAAANADAVALVREAVDGAVDGAGPTVPVVVSGNLGPRGDGYTVTSTMTVEEAEAYHRPQVEALAGAGAHRVTALTMTYAEEAAGIVRAADALGVPVVVCFTVETDGRLPSGGSLADAVAAVDELTGGAALHLGVNCAHPDHVRDALASLGDVAPRVRTYRPNASRQSHAELDVATELDAGDPVELGEQVAELRRRHPDLQVLGGCCGTDVRHVTEMVRAVGAGRAEPAPGLGARRGPVSAPAGSGGPAAERPGQPSGSRRTGQLMHRGPPRPEPSWSPGISSTSMPASRSAALVPVLRS